MRTCFFQTGSSYISAVNWDISMKFGLLIHFELRKSVTTLNTKPEVVWSRRGRHVEIECDVITTPRVARARFGRNLGTRFRTACTQITAICSKVQREEEFQPPNSKSFFAVFFYFPNAVWASASGGFRIVSDTLVAEVISWFHWNLFLWFGLIY